MRYRLRRVRVGPAARQGGLAGGLIGTPLGAAAGLLAAWLLHAARQTVEAWRVVRLTSPPPLPNPPPVNFVSLLHLDALLAALQRWDATPALVLGAAAVGLAAGLLLGGLVGALSALLFNLSGGAEVELEPLER